MQGATEKFLKTVPTDYYTKLNATLEEHAKIVVAYVATTPPSHLHVLVFFRVSFFLFFLFFLHSACTGIPGLEITPPQGAMYAMVRIKHEEFADIADDAAFTQLLLNEQNVMVLPGSCFKVCHIMTRAQRLHTTQPLRYQVAASSRSLRLALACLSRYFLHCLPFS
jgi:hypothetical protein